MSTFISQPALLKNLAGAHLPPEALNVSVEFQFCVDAGACAAACFVDQLTAVGLHDHIAVSMQGFLHSMDSAIASESLEAGRWLRERKQRCIDAFGAGYLGRVHQKLRLIHPVQSSERLAPGGYSGTVK